MSLFHIILFQMTKEVVDLKLQRTLFQQNATKQIQDLKTKVWFLFQ